MTATRPSYRAHAWALLVLGLPIVGSHLAAFFIHVSDTVMLGWYGVEELAAVVIGGTFWFILFILGSGFGTALPAIVAGAAAQGDERQIRRATRMAMWLTIGYSLAIAPIFIFAEQILLLLGQVPAVAERAADYLIVAGWSVVPALLTNLFRHYLSALERAGIVLALTLIAFVLHLGLNWLLIFGNLGFPELGITGAGISTLATDSALLVIVALVANRLFPGHQLFVRFWRPDPEMLSRIFHLGWPIGLQLLAEVGLFASAAVMMGWVSAEMLAAHGIAIQLASTTFLVHLGLSNAATIRAGQAVGRRDPAFLRDGALTAVVMSVAFATVTIAIFLSIPVQLVSLFLDPADPETPAVIAAGVTLVTMAAVFQLADGGQAMAIGLLRGVQDTRVPMIIAVVCYWGVGLPFCYALGFGLGWGGVGVWIGLTISLTVVWVALSVRFWGGAVQRAVPAAA